MEGMVSHENRWLVRKIRAVAPWRGKRWLS